MGPSKPAKPAPPPLRTLLAAAFIAVAAFLPFIPALTAGFCQFDDPGILKDVDGYRGLAPSNLRWMFTTTQMGHYQPLTWLSYGAEYVLWGRDPAGQWGLNPAAFHTTNILFHCANAVLVFFLARRLLSAALGLSGPSFRLDLGGAGAALLFAVHPLRVESVAWVTERRDVLSSFFLLLSALAYLRAFPPRTTSIASVTWYVASIALLTLSLLAKAWGMTFFAILLVLDWFPLRRLGGPPRAWFRPPILSVLLQKLPYLALGLAAAVMAAHATASARFTVLSLEQWGIGARVGQAMFGLMFYLQKLVWPTRLVCIYELPRVFNPGEERFIAAYAFTSALVLIALASRKRWPAVTAAIAIYAITLAPVLGFRQSGPQMVADRYSYLANISWALLAAGAALAWARRPRAPAPILALSIIALGVLATLSWRQTGFWRDSEALFKRAVDAGPDGPIAREFYGRQLSENGKKEAALYQFQQGIKLDRGYAECWFSEANTLKDMGRFPEAEQSYTVARKLMADSWRASLMQGMMYITLSDRFPEGSEPHLQALKGAEACFRDSIANAESLGYDPLPGRPYLMLAAALELQGDEKGSRQLLERAARLPDTRDEALLHLRGLDAPADPSTPPATPPAPK